MATGTVNKARLLAPGEEGLCSLSVASQHPTHLTIIIIGPLGG